MKVTGTPWEAIHGRPEPPVAMRPLRAGAVDVMLDGVDLRYVRVGGVEVVRRVYVAVRDINWDTLPGVVSHLAVHDESDRFTVRFSCRHARGAVDFSWDGSIAGEPDGAIEYRMDGVAGSGFEYNRIGFCVLHPYRESIGARYEARTPSGPIEGTLPDLIAPQRFADGHHLALFDAFDDLRVEIPGGGAIRFAFAGDLFEIEDQRNWTDASLKTYCTPLALVHPRRAREGQAIRQAVRMTFSLPARAARPQWERPATELRLGAPVRRGMAEIGLGSPSHGVPLTDRQRAALRALAPDHLRADVRLSDPAHEQLLARVLADCAAVGAKLELALFLVEADAARLDAIAALLRDSPVARVLVFASDAASPGPRETTPAPLVAVVRRALARDDVPVGGGTDLYFCELNRTRPDAAALDVVSWSVNPQVHAFDERSIVETLAAQAETVRSALAFAPGVPLVVSPVTLKPRFNPNATRAEGSAEAGELPSPVDPRQASLFAAAWTVGSVKRLVEAGADAITYFEPTGWTGLMELEGGPPLPDRFPSTPGMIFPVYHVFAAFAGRRGDDVLALDPGDPLRLAGIALRGSAGLRIVVANLTPEPVEATVDGLPAKSALLRALDDECFAMATSDAEAFRRRSAVMPVNGSRLGLTLGPYAVATVDAAE